MHGCVCVVFDKQSFATYKYQCSAVGRSENLGGGGVISNGVGLICPPGWNKVIIHKSRGEVSLRARHN